MRILYFVLACTASAAWAQDWYPSEHCPSDTLTAANAS